MKLHKYNKLGFSVWLWVIILFVLIGFGEQLFDPETQEYIKVEEKSHTAGFAENDSLRPVLRVFDSEVIVTGYPQIKFNENNYLLKLFAPNRIFLDPVYGLLIITICIIFLVRMRKLNIDKPFSSQIVDGVKWAGIACLLFAVGDYLRLYLINRYIQTITDNIYRLERFTLFTTIAFWTGIMLSWLHRILKKAEVLQKEQDLTV